MIFLDEQKKEVLVGKKEKLWKTIFIGSTIFFLLVILFLISISIKSVGGFLSAQGGILLVSLLAFGLMGAIVFVLLKKKEAEQDIHKIIAKIRREEFKTNGVIISPTNFLADPITTDNILFEFEDVDMNDGNPSKRMVFSYNKRTGAYFPFSLGTKKDAKLSLERSEFHRKFLEQYEAGEKLKELQDKMGITTEKGD